MEDVIKVSWGTGYYELSLSQFFPNTKAVTSKVFRVLACDPYWQKEKMLELHRYFTQRTQDCLSAAEWAKKEAVQESESASVYGKRENGYKYHKELAKSATERAKKLEKEAKKIRETSDILLAEWRKMWND